MHWTIILAVLFIFFPALILYGEKRSKVLAWLSPVVLCYLFGIILANIRIVPIDTSLATVSTQATVIIAIPMLLFSMDFRRWLRLARKTIISFSFAVLAVLVMSVIAVFLFRDRIEDAWIAAGMLVGVYTGGTPNMAAIGISLDAPDRMYILLNAADVALSSVYLLFLMTVAHRLLLRFMPAFESSGNGGGEGLEEITEKVVTATQIGHRDVLRAFGLSALVAAVSIGLAFLLKELTGGEELSTTVIILSITTLGIAGSFIPKVRELVGTYETGQYCLLIFCVAIGTLADIRELVAAFTGLFSYTAFVLIGAIVLHYLLAAIFRIDADTAIITSTAAVFGPAFVGPIGNVLKNREIIVSGLTTGVIGYALGTYLGILLARLLMP